jgi:hypothetical protein
MVPQMSSSARPAFSVSVSATAQMAFGAVGIWLCFPWVSLSAKCFLTEQCAFSMFGSDSDGGGGGANFGHPITAAMLHLLLVGTTLTCWNNRCHCRSGTTTNTYDVDDNAVPRPTSGGGGTIIRIDTNNNNNNTALDSNTAQLSYYYMFRQCFFLGVAFGGKYMVAHAALQITPTAIYELFHCLNLVFVAILSHFVLHERLETCGEWLNAFGVLVGSLMALGEGLSKGTNDDDGDNNEHHLILHTPYWWWALTLNLFNGILAGTVVVLLRLALLQCQRRVAMVTAWKMCIGGIVLLPVAAWIDGVTAIQLIWTSWKACFWLGLSSLAILIYHLMLAFLCSVAVAPTVAMVEALRPVTAFALLAWVQNVPLQNKSPRFWWGSALILCCTGGFEWFRKTKPLRYSPPPPSTLVMATERTTLLTDTSQE